MATLYLILTNLNALFSLVIFIIAILEFIDYEYPNRKKVKATIDKHLDPLLKKFNIKLEEKFKYFLLLLIPVIIGIIILILSSIIY